MDGEDHANDNSYEQHPFRVMNKRRNLHILEMDGQRGLDSAAPSHNRARLQGALDDAQRVMQGAVHLIQHEVVRASQQN